MKRSLRLLFCAFSLLCGVACARHTIIPDEKLALIFHDAFLANAYTGGRNVVQDSLNLYEPIFARYGYTTEDVQYTIGNFSKRKSARLGDVVERAIEMLEAEGGRYNREVAILDTIDNVALRNARRVVRADSLIRVRSLADTARLRFVFDVEPGDYTVEMRYLIDSLDRNTRNPKVSMWLERSDSVAMQRYTATLRRLNEGSVQHKFSVDSTHRRLHVDFFTFADKPRRPSVTVRNFEVAFTPPKQEAVEQLYRQQLGLRIFADEFFRAAHAKDSI